MSDRPLEAGGRYVIKHTTRSGKSIIDELRYRIDVNTLHRDETATSLGLNEIGRVHLRTSTPLMVDEYRLNRATGSFILIELSANSREHEVWQRPIRTYFRLDADGWKLVGLERMPDRRADGAAPRRAAR